MLGPADDRPGPPCDDLGYQRDDDPAVLRKQVYQQTLADLLANGTTARDAKNEAKQIADEAMAVQREARARRPQENAEQKNAADEALVARLPPRRSLRSQTSAT